MDSNKLIDTLKHYFKDLPQNQPVRVSQLSGAQVGLVLIISGLFGFCIGMFGEAAWQTVVQPAQTMAGIVKYPDQNPNYLGQTAFWTIFHQICALGLHLGMSERMLSFIFSGILGMVSFQALSLCVLALSHDKGLAIASAFFIHFTKATDFGVVYAIFLMGQPHTYGILGRTWILLSLALMGTGQYRWGGLLAGLSLAVHPALGAFLLLVVALSFIWDFRNLRDAFRKAAPYFLGGCFISLVSLAYHMFVTYDMPPIEPEMASKYLATFIQLWDDHRPVVSFRSEGVYLVLASLVLCSLWLLLFKRDLPNHSLFLLRAFVVSAVLGLGLSIITQLPYELIPKSLLKVIPGRYLNLNILGFMSLLIALLGCYKNTLKAQFILSILIVSLIVSRMANFALYNMSRSALFSILNTVLRGIWSGQTHRQILWMMMVAVSLAMIVGQYVTVNRRHVLHFVRGVILVALGIVIFMVGIQTYAHWINKTYGELEWMTNDLRDWTNDPLFAEAHKGQGMLLTCADMYLIQLRTRKPVLLEGGALNTVSYFPAIGLEMEGILREIYGIDFFDPPKEALHSAIIPVRYTKEVWEIRMPEEWRNIRKHFGVTDVLTYIDWNLKLPEVIRNDRFILYHIPE